MNGRGGFSCCTTTKLIQTCYEGFAAYQQFSGVTSAIYHLGDDMLHYYLNSDDFICCIDVKARSFRARSVRLSSVSNSPVAVVLSFEQVPSDCFKAVF